LSALSLIAANLNVESGDKPPHSKMRETKSQRKERTEEIIKLLKRAHSDARCALNHSNAFELLIATILSAQCTDERVNIVTADLFRKYRKPEDYLKVPASELQQDIRTTGFFRNKAKSIQGACRMLVEEFDSQVPRTMEELLKLPGVARKTANVVLGVAYGVAAGVVVDTHVSRLSQRLGLTKKKDAGKIEQDLMDLVPRKDWIIFAHLLIFHGRRVCKARRPLCEECVAEKLCPSSLLKQRNRQ
jgi:endonuclease-3